MSSAHMREHKKMEHGKAHTKVAGDDEMLRTGFINGTPLEAGKIADSEPVDLFAPARGIAKPEDHHHHHDEQQQQQMRRSPREEEDEGQEEGEKKQQQVAGGGGLAVADENYAAVPEVGQQGMANMREHKKMEHGKAHAKVAGDDEMLRTGFVNGTPLEAGKIADSEPVDLFAPARGIAKPENHHHHDEQQQQQMRRPPGEEDEGHEEEGEKKQQQVAGGGGLAVATENYAAVPEVGRQGMPNMRKHKKMEHGKAHTKVAGDDEMLRTGFVNGTPLEAGKIADSEPVDLFAPARGIAKPEDHHHHDEQQQQQMRRPPGEEDEGHEEGEKKQQQVAGGGGLAVADENYAAHPEVARQGMAAPTAGGRRLGRQ